MTAAVPVPLIELCVDSLETAIAAQTVGADRIELCGPGEGGLTPSAALLADVMAAVQIPVHVMIRPREGGFIYTNDEFAAMGASIDAAQAAGVAGVVFGMLRADGTLDGGRMRTLVLRARPMRVACHRAFDATPDADAALQTLLMLGVDLVLTSGHASTAVLGAATLARHVQQAGEQLTILAGGSVRAENVHELLDRSGVHEVHARGLDSAVTRALMESLRPARR